MTLRWCLEDGHVEDIDGDEGGLNEDTFFCNCDVSHTTPYHRSLISSTLNAVIANMFVSGPEKASKRECFGGLSQIEKRA